ncbi:DUF4381 domain-containing protein [Pseudorhodobacter sp.]|uniref:DUF4381 domain-containing protein n=1 Tax=Pseudorhodobacter sp. TaxID=1934400 RepID=UPI002649742E|nr:DUF4381 domain-containing protein [Pseudorhodobacter sp.]MDN5787955.1 DUF4381 domain-containing protein [Pseudorhodobacter sp.]
MTPLSPEMQAELAKLHDIRLPEPVGWWPLATGIWVLIALAAVLLLLALALIAHRRRTVRYAALAELSRLKTRLDSNAGDPDVATDLAILLRRIVLTGPEARGLASVSGVAWVAELGRGPGGLTPQTAALIANAPYAPTGSAQAAQGLRSALTEAETWIRRRAK